MMSRTDEGKRRQGYKTRRDEWEGVRSTAGSQGVTQTRSHGYGKGETRPRCLLYFFSGLRRSQAGGIYMQDTSVILRAK